MLGRSQGLPDCRSSSGLTSITTSAKRRLSGVENGVRSWGTISVSVCRRTSRIVPLLTSSSPTDAANDVFSSLHVFLALRELAEDDTYLKHVSNNSSSASSWRPLGQQVRHHSTHALPTRSPSPTVDPSTGRKSAPTARQRETYEFWQREGLPVEAVAIRMGIKPLSVVWNLLACLSTVEGDSMEFDRQRLLDALDEVGGGVPKMLEENAPLLERVRGELGIVD